jgi:UDP-N-acetylmuramoyl-tripeptide--D-alanyl-D-alanine ligase
MRPDAVAIANADDAHVGALAAAFAGRVVWFGAETSIRAGDVRCGPNGAATFRLVVDDAATAVTLRIPGRHNVANAVAAAAVAHAVGIGLPAIAAGLAAAAPVGNRMRVFELATGATIVNDSYNANPASVAAALRTLAESPARRRIAVLGEMLELGPSSAEHHHAVGRLAAELGVDALYLLGEHAGDAAAGARATQATIAVHVEPSHDAIAAALRGAIGPGDWVLVKGSRGQRMEEVVRLLEGEA